MMEVTASSWKLFQAYGGLSAVLPYDFDVYEICNPGYVLGLLQFQPYRLRPTQTLQPRNASYNVLLVPRSRAQVVERLRVSR
jgi:hypothetical protein